MSWLVYRRILDLQKVLDDPCHEAPDRKALLTAQFLHLLGKLLQVEARVQSSGTQPPQFGGLLLGPVTGIGL
jgi:hypothetical protein